MNDDKSPLKVAEQEGSEQAVRKEDPFRSWILFFLHSSTQAKNPRLSFYARVLSGMQTHATKQVGYMAVGFLHGSYVLLYNPEWTRRTTYTEFVCTLAHESMHIILRHIPRSMRRLAVLDPNDRAAAHHIMNVAMDATLNEQIERHFPHMRTGASGYWVFPEPLGLPKNAAFEDLFEIMWSYRQALMQRMQEILEERKQKCDEEGQSTPAPGGEEEGDGEGQGKGDGEGQGQGQGQSQGDGQSGSGSGESQKSQDSWAPGTDAFENTAQAMADLAEAGAHEWSIRPAEDGQPTGESDADYSGMDAGELDANATLLEEAGKELVKHAVREQENARGTVPADLRVEIDAMLEEPIVPWARLLKNMVVARMLARRKNTMTRPHKRRHILWFFNEDTGLIERYARAIPQYPGHTRDRTYVALFAIDTSGSMSENDIKEGLSEMKGILDAYEDAHLIAVQCDTRISSVEVVGPDMDVDEYVKTIGRTSYGGTTFDDPFMLANYIRDEGRPPRLPNPEETRRLLRDYDTVDVVVYHTDGYAPMPSDKVRPSCPTIWLTTSNSRTSDISFGHVIER